MSIPGKRRLSLAEEQAEEQQHTECLTPRTSTTATDNTATTSAALTPLTVMETPEIGPDDTKSLAETTEEEQPASLQESSWQGWAELENDPVGSSPYLILIVL